MNNITSTASCDANKNNLTFDCNKCKFIFFKWNTFNTHMKRQRFIALCRITLIGQMYWGSQTHETKAILYLSNESHLIHTYRDNVSLPSVDTRAANLFKISFRASAERVQALPINLRYIYKRVFTGRQPRYISSSACTRLALARKMILKRFPALVTSLQDCLLRHKTILQTCDNWDTDYNS